MVKVRLLEGIVNKGGVYFAGQVLEMDELDAALGVKLGVAEILAGDAPQKPGKAGSKRGASVQEDLGGAEVSDG